MRVNELCLVDDRQYQLNAGTALQYLFTASEDDQSIVLFDDFDAGKQDHYRKNDDSAKNFKHVLSSGDFSNTF
jgi:hypothetical protein